MGKSTISMAIFSSYVSHNQRVTGKSDLQILEFPSATFDSRRVLLLQTTRTIACLYCALHLLVRNTACRKEGHLNILKGRLPWKKKLGSASCSWINWKLAFCSCCKIVLKSKRFRTNTHGHTGAGSSWSNILWLRLLGGPTVQFIIITH